jgi:hypothetical protein
MMQKWIAATVLIVALVASASLAEAQNRLAFVVGNDAYQTIDPLKKAVNDARAMAQGLQKLGFKVTLGENLKRPRIHRTLQRVREFRQCRRRRLPVLLRPRRRTRRRQLPDSGRCAAGSRRSSRACSRTSRSRPTTSSSG